MSRRIVAIDDSPVALNIIGATLTEFGFEDVTFFDNPVKALEEMKAERLDADLILLDVMMPEMDGIELCARIRELQHWTDVPIVMLTSRKDIEALSSAFMAGANDYVTKPFDSIELHARIRSCLRLKSELDRRKSGGGRAGARAGRPLTAPVSAIVAGPEALQTALDALPVERIGELGLIALRIDGTAEGMQARRDWAEGCARVADTLARVPVPVGDLLALWSDNIFCYASLQSDAPALRARADQFLAAVRDALLAAPPGAPCATITASAGIAAPGGFGTVASGLADAILAAETAAREGGDIARLARPTVGT